MKTSLLSFIATTQVWLFLSLLPADGQTVLFSEDFSGFTTGTHVLPSTIDASSQLDSKTAVPGWSGAFIYPAGGEVKIGKSSDPGYMETPLLDLTVTGGSYTIRFDIARYPGDASRVSVLLNGTQTGAEIVPSDNFETVTINCLEAPQSVKIRIAGLAKRFFLDNFMVLNETVTAGDPEIKIKDKEIKVFPVPASSELIVRNLFYTDFAEIIDLNGRSIMILKPGSENEMRIPVGNFEDGLYFIRFRKGNIWSVIRFVKLGYAEQH